MWCVLKNSDGYLGQAWEPNGSGGLTSPRTALVDLQDATLFPSREAAHEEAAHAKQILGRGFSALNVQIEGRGKEARIVAMKTAVLDYL
jgi:hypothetical protein